MPRYVCVSSGCGFTGVTYRQLLRHERQKHQTRWTCCPACGSSFATPQGFITHRAEDHSLAFQANPAMLPPLVLLPPAVKEIPVKEKPVSQRLGPPAVRVKSERESKAKPRSKPVSQRLGPPTAKHVRPRSPIHKRRCSSPTRPTAATRRPPSHAWRPAPGRETPAATPARDVRSVVVNMKDPLGLQLEIDLAKQLECGTQSPVPVHF